jgi:predicted secreted protein
MSKFLIAAGAVFGIAVWFLLFVILGIGLGTAFIAGGCVLAAGLIAAGMVFTSVRPVLDAPLTAPGLLLGIAAFAVLEVVLSVPMWVGVITGLSVMGLYDLIDAALRRPRVTARSEAKAAPAPSAVAWQGNGHERPEAETVGAA